MTAPTNPAPLPVVASVIWHLRTRPDVPLVLAKSVHAVLHGPHPTDVDAVTVPLDLWNEPSFVAAVWQRVTYSEATVLGETLAAIAAELRARADTGARE